MTSTDDQLFSPEEALIRLAQNREQGCLTVFKGHELVKIYVRDSYIISASGVSREGAEAIEHALHLTESSYLWQRGAQPPHPDKNFKLLIKEFILKHGNVNQPKLAETGRLTSGIEKKGSESKYKYYLVPEGQPTIKHVLTKAATVLGRDNSSDLVIDHFDVSRRHCLLDIQARGLFVLDLDSTNGTYVNGILIRDGYLNPGDTLELGDYQLTVNREVRK